jgi:hypothetical protein
LSGRISALEFDEWLAYNTLEPIGAQRADLNAGIIASVIANVNRDARKRKEPFTAKDFMPEYDREPGGEPVEKWRQQKAAMKALQAAQSRKRK